MNTKIQDLKAAAIHVLGKDRTGFADEKAVDIAGTPLSYTADGVFAFTDAVRGTDEKAVKLYLSLFKIHKESISARHGTSKWKFPDTKIVYWENSPVFGYMVGLAFSSYYDKFKGEVTEKSNILLDPHFCADLTKRCIEIEYSIKLPGGKSLTLALADADQKAINKLYDIFTACDFIEDLKLYRDYLVKFVKPRLEIQTVYSMIEVLEKKIEELKEGKMYGDRLALFNNNIGCPLLPTLVKEMSGHKQFFAKNENGSLTVTDNYIVLRIADAKGLHVNDTQTMPPVHKVLDAKDDVWNRFDFAKFADVMDRIAHNNENADYKNIVLCMKSYRQDEEFSVNFEKMCLCTRISRRIGAKDFALTKDSKFVVRTPQGDVISTAPNTRDTIKQISDRQKIVYINLDDMVVNRATEQKDGTNLQDIVETRLRAGDSLTNTDIKAICKSIDVDFDNVGPVKEAIELALFRVAKSICESAKGIRAKYDAIIDLYNRQPIVGAKKTLRQMSLAQYSTALPISFLMSQFVNRGDRDALYFEPSAGNGFLTIALPQSQTIVNEIDQLRYDNLCLEHYRKVTRQDGRQPFYDYERRCDGVVTNPPFIKEIDTMIFNALDTMKDNGRAAILRDGNNMFENYAGTQLRTKNLSFFDKLMAEYNVVKIINLDTKKIYAKQGTAFFMQVILIDGRKAEPEYTNRNRVFNPSVDIVKLCGFEDLWHIFAPYIGGESRLLIGEMVARLGKGLNGADEKEEEDRFKKYRDFIGTAFKNKNSKSLKDCTDLISKDILKKINTQVAIPAGKKITVYAKKVYICAKSIRHAYNSHKNDSLTTDNQISLTIDDLMRIPELLANPKIETAKTNVKNGTSIRLHKDFGDSILYCVIVINNLDCDEWITKTSYKKKKEGTLRGTDAALERTPQYKTSETPNPRLILFLTANIVDIYKIPKKK